MENDDANTPAAGTLVWQALKEKLADETAPELAVSRFVLQRDAYVRLSEDDISGDAPFLSYEYGGGTSDDDLSLYMFFFRDGLSIDIGPVNFGFDWVNFSYGQTFAAKLGPEDDPAIKPDAIAVNVILLIKAVLGGAIVAGLNYRRNRLVATELFALDGRHRPVPIGIVASFPALARAADEFAVRQNRVIDERVRLPKDFPLLPPNVNGKRVSRGRVIDSIDDLSPLTHKEADTITNEANFHQAFGKDPGTHLDWMLYRTIPFWLTAVALIAVALFLRFSPLTPEIFHSPIALLVVVLAGRYGISFITGMWLAARHARIQRGERPVTLRIEDAIGRFFKRLRRLDNAKHK